MSRFKANILLLIAAIIWGTTFVAQKFGMDSMGPFGFVTIRYLISALVVLPFMVLEMRRTGGTLNAGDGADIQPEPVQAQAQIQVQTQTQTLSARKTFYMMAALVASFFLGVMFQQFGILTTTVTNAGFLTGLYVVFTPVVAILIFRKKPQPIIWFASPLCLVGIWMLGGGSYSQLVTGDFLTAAGAVFFAFHTVLITVVVLQTHKPMTLAFWQFFICGILALPFTFMFEVISWAAIYEALPSLLYAGLLSGGVAYTFQIIAQQHTPPSDAALILSGEALFAAFSGFLVLGERLTPMAWGGCALIFVIIVSVEFWPAYKRQREKRRKALS